MTFKSEFEIYPKDMKPADVEQWLIWRKKQSGAKLGEKIAEVLGFAQTNFGNPDRYKIEIVAYPIKDWETFLEDLRNLVPAESREEVWRLILKLASSK